MLMAFSPPCLKKLLAEGPPSEFLPGIVPFHHFTGRAIRVVLCCHAACSVFLRKLFSQSSFHFLWPRPLCVSSANLYDSLICIYLFVQPLIAWKSFQLKFLPYFGIIWILIWVKNYFWGGKVYGRKILIMIRQIIFLNLQFGISRETHIRSA